MNGRFIGGEISLIPSFSSVKRQTMSSERALSHKSSPLSPFPTPSTELRVGVTELVSVFLSPSFSFFLFRRVPRTDSSRSTPFFSSFFFLPSPPFGTTYLREIFYPRVPSAFLFSLTPPPFSFWWWCQALTRLTPPFPPPYPRSCSQKKSEIVWLCNRVRPPVGEQPILFSPLPPPQKPFRDDKPSMIARCFLS